MPLIAYLCECKNSKKKYCRQVKDVPAFIICDLCGKEMKKCLSSPTNSSKITVDNGFQARQVEIDPDIVEINQKRSEKDYRNED
jgi:hypothetical protein